MSKAFSTLKWIFSVSSRFSRVDRKGRSKVTSFLATLGISFGVMALIVVMSIMNGFQMSFIDAIQEISSYHIRVTSLPPECELDFIEWCESNPRIKSVSSFYEAQGLVTSPKGFESVALIRAIDSEVCQKDEGFAREMKIISGSFDLARNDSIVIGATMAVDMGVRLGQQLNLFALSGGNDVQLLSNDRLFTITGIFSTGYQDINSAFAFISEEAGKINLGKDATLCHGVKLVNTSSDSLVISQMKKQFPDAKIVGWREYNKLFFGTLRIEKNMLLFLVALIFIVVAINIYNGMRRLVFERKAEISTLSALGAKNTQIKFIFVLQGFLSGVKGAFSGLILGLLISVNSPSVFRFASKLMYFFSYISTAITNPQNLVYLQENPMYELYASIPARVFPAETVFITAFGILAPLLASYAASRNVLKMTVAEVLHDE